MLENGLKVLSLSKGSCNIRISYHCSGILWVLNVLPHLRVYDPLAGCAGLAVVQLPAGEAVRHPLHRDVLVARQRQVAHPAAEVLHVPVSRTYPLIISSHTIYNLHLSSAAVNSTEKMSSSQAAHRGMFILAAKWRPQ